MKRSILSELEDVVFVNEIINSLEIHIFIALQYGIANSQPKYAG